MHPHRILSLLFLLLLSLALGACASHDARPAPEPGAPLPAVTLERGDRVFIKIENGKSMTEDLHSMLTAYLQSERGLNPASDVKEADLVILVEIRDVWATSDGSRVSAGRTLGNVGTGTMLGVLLGGLVDGRGGAIVGAGIGATVGVGATLHDAGDSYTSWAMEAAVGTAARRIPDKDSLHTVAVTSRGNPRSKEEAFAGLEDALCRAILDVKVKAGDVVKGGQTLCVLEAMKMENEIPAPKDGTVAQVVVTKGASVNAGDALVILA